MIYAMKFHFASQIANLGMDMPSINILEFLCKDKYINIIFVYVYVSSNP